VGKIGGRRNGGFDNQPPFLRRAGLYLGVAFELPGTILAGLVIGYFLDRYFDTSPWLLILFTLLAFTGAFVRLVRLVKYFSGERNGNNGKKNDSAH
jgi:ATP synthase protein I